MKGLKPEDIKVIIATDCGSTTTKAVVMRLADATVAAIFRQFGGAYLAQYGAGASDEQLRVLQLLALCRTPSLGFTQWECTACGFVHQTYNPCRDRHCPQCQNHLAGQWYDARGNDILRLRHQHVIFTAPHEIQVLLDVWENRPVIYRLFMHATRDALQKVARETLGLTLGMLIILHTWNQWLEQHLHTHTVLPGGGWLLPDRQRFVVLQGDQWLDKQRLMEAFRAALLGHLERAAERGKLVFAGDAACLDNAAVFGDWLQRLHRRAWFLRVRPPLAGAEAALGYLARYTRRVALGNRRVLEIDTGRGTVTFGYRKNAAGPQGADITASETIAAVEFIRRFLLHVMPKGMGRTQFYGWWASRNKKEELPRIRAQLGAAATDSSAAPADAPDATLPEEMEEVLRRKCPQCGEQALEKVCHVPAPPRYDLMAIVLWPQQRKTAREPQPLLPGMATWVAGGEQFRASLLAQTGWSPLSGFT